VVQRGPFSSAWIEDGELRPARVTTISFTRYGKLAWLAAEGALLKQGEEVMRLDPEGLDETLQRQEGELAAAELELEEQRRMREAEKERLEDELRTEQDRLTLAELKEKDVLSRPDPLAAKVVDDAVQETEERLRDAQADLAAYEPLVEQGFGSRNELEGRRLNEKLALCRNESALLSAAEVKAGATHLERDNARRATERTQADLALCRLRSERRMLELDALVRNAEQKLAAARRRRDETQQNLDAGVCRAPHGGVVVYQTTSRGRERRKPMVGDAVSPWRKPIALSDYSVMKVRSKIPETLIADMELGKSRFRLTTAVQPNREYHALLSWMDRWAWDRHESLSEEDQRRQGLSGTRVFNIEAVLEESDPEHLREGFQTRVEFPLAVLNDVLFVPRRAVFSAEGRKTVRVRPRGKNDFGALRFVQTGPEGRSGVVIHSGLDEDEAVFVPADVVRTELKKDAEKDEP
jgi:multidrug resistance efflux pump